MKVLGGLLATVFLFTSYHCASTSSIQNAPLHAGISRSFNAGYMQTLKAAREAMVETGLQIETATEVDKNNYMIIGKKGTSAFSWGELVRVVVTRSGPGETTVRVYTKRRIATNLAAKGDYANSILSNIELKLKESSSLN